jgi:hypothetical protein
MRQAKDNNNCNEISCERGTFQEVLDQVGVYSLEDMICIGETIKFYSDCGHRHKGHIPMYHLGSFRRGSIEQTPFGEIDWTYDPYSMRTFFEPLMIKIYNDMMLDNVKDMSTFGNVFYSYVYTGLLAIYQAIRDDFIHLTYSDKRDKGFWNALVCAAIHDFQSCNCNSKCRDLCCVDNMSKVINSKCLKCDGLSVSIVLGEPMYSGRTEWMCDVIDKLSSRDNLYSSVIWSEDHDDVWWNFENNVLYASHLRRTGEHAHVRAFSVLPQYSIYGYVVSSFTLFHVNLLSKIKQDIFRGKYNKDETIAKLLHPIRLYKEDLYDPVGNYVVSEIFDIIVNGPMEVDYYDHERERINAMIFNNFNEISEKRDIDFLVDVLEREFVNMNDYLPIMNSQNMNKKRKLRPVQTRYMDIEKGILQKDRIYDISRERTDLCVGYEKCNFDLLGGNKIYEIMMKDFPKKFRLFCANVRVTDDFVEKPRRYVNGKRNIGTRNNNKKSTVKKNVKDNYFTKGTYFRDFLDDINTHEYNNDIVFQDDIGKFDWCDDGSSDDFCFPISDKQRNLYEENFPSFESSSDDSSDDINSSGDDGVKRTISAKRRSPIRSRRPINRKGLRKDNGFNHDIFKPVNFSSKGLVKRVPVVGSSNNMNYKKSSSVNLSYVSVKDTEKVRKKEKNIINVRNNIGSSVKGNVRNNIKNIKKKGTISKKLSALKVSGIGRSGNSIGNVKRNYNMISAHNIERKRA